MKTIDAFLVHLKSLNVKLWNEDGDLCYSAPDAAMTPALRTELAEHKTEIIKFLNQADQAARFHLPPIQLVPRDEDLPLSFAQQRMWFLDKLEGENAAYNISITLRLDGYLHSIALEQSLQEIVRRHESLRTCFPVVNGAPVVQLSVNHYQLAIINLEELPPAAQAIELQNFVSEQAQRPFDLAKGLLFRTALWKLGEQEHLLQLNMHHIISDGWSIGIFFKELSTLYEAFSQGKPSPLPALSVQYVDFAQWQRQWLSGHALEKQVNYWKQQLAGAPALLELPTDFPRSLTQGFQGASEPLQLTSSLTGQLKKLSQQAGTTLFMTLLSAFAILLSRYTSSNDIVIGSPIANRTHGQIEPLIGFFVNTLVLRINLEGNPRFEELLRQVQRVALDAYAHQDIPFEKLVEELQPERNLSHNPLFQVMFTLQNAPRDSLKLSGLNLRPIVSENITARFDLSLFVTETAQGLAGTFEYNMNLFERATIERLSGHVQTLLTGIVKSPITPVHELPLLTATERQQLLAWNDTAADYPVNQCIHQLFEVQVEKTPDVVALVFEAQQLTYRDLNSKANQVAHYLLSLGVKPEVPAGICIERSLNMVIGLLGILKAGGAYLPLDPAYPAARLAFMLEDARVPVLLTQLSLKERLKQLNTVAAQVVCLDADAPALSSLSVDNPSSRVEPSNLAYVIYTSGSTGKPKGVLGTHKGMVNRLNWMWQTYPFEAEEVCCHRSSINFVDHVAELFSPLLKGISLVLLTKENMRDVADIVNVLYQYKIRRLVIVPSLLEMILEQGDQALQNLASMKHWFCSGEELPTHLVKLFYERLSEACLLNIYGSSEVSADVMAYRAERQDIHSVPIGKPISNTQVYILDHHLQLVPIGVPGELHIGGAGLARGYLNRPDLTQEKFIPNPFSDELGSRLYKTGDLARYLPDGNIECLGRLDHQVKIRGFRIELGEIEAVLAQHPTVQKNVVIAHEEPSYNKRLIAYLTPKPERFIDNISLRGFLKERLPNYMIPSAFVSLEAMPLTPNGKIDRRALPAPDQAKQELQKNFSISDSADLELEGNITVFWILLLKKIWEEILGIHPLGIRDNFFELGGHSLLAVRLFSQIEKTTDIKIPMTSLFQAPTIEQLADVIVIREKEDSSWSSLVPIQRCGSKPPLFLAHWDTGQIPIAACYRLARYLGPEQPFYGLQAVGLDGTQAPHNRFEDMATHYIKEIRAVQPEGPYLLAGICHGALVAFEMAQQLHAQGHKVGLLAFIAPAHPIIYYTEDSTKVELKVSPEVPPIIGTQYDARLNYKPQFYQGQVTCFQGEVSAIHSLMIQLEWAKLAAGGVNIHKVPGKEHIRGPNGSLTSEYFSILTEPQNVQVIAKKLTVCVDDAIVKHEKARGLAEKGKISKKHAKKPVVEKKVKGRKFDLEDFRSQLIEMLYNRKFSNLKEQSPNMSQRAKAQLSEKKIAGMIAIINSMTLHERHFPIVIKHSRKRRIAMGSGTKIQEVNQLLKHFVRLKKMIMKPRSKQSQFDLSAILR